MTIQNLIYRNENKNMIRMIDINGVVYRPKMGDNEPNWYEILGDRIKWEVKSYRFFASASLYIST